MGIPPAQARLLRLAWSPLQRPPHHFERNPRHDQQHRPRTPRSDALILKFHELRSARDVALSELAADASGDVADRATNVDANVRFALLEQRINAVEAELSNGPTARARATAASRSATS